MKVTLDGAVSEVEEGTTIEALARRMGVRLIPGCVLAVKRAIPPEKVETNLYRITTNRGKMVVRLECEKVVAGWRRAFSRFNGSGLRWVTREAAVFGPIVTDFEPSQESVEVKQHEVVLSLSGYSNEATHLVLGKRLHTSAYAPPKGCGVMGRIVYGRHLVDELRMGDRIEEIEPVVVFKEGEGAVRKAGPGEVLREPVEIFTKVAMELDGASPLSGEVIYKTTAGGALGVHRKTSRFVACDDINLVSLKAERQHRRGRGSVTVRNAGSRLGSVYLYLKEAALSPSHSLAGTARLGMELADVLGEGDRVAVEVRPEPLGLLGGTMAEAAKALAAKGIAIKRLGETGDGALVVEHDPPTTLEVYARKEVSCTGADPSKVLRVRLFQEEAPVTVRYFRRVTGLEMRRTGRLEVFFTTPKNDIVLLKGDDFLAKELLPENTPTSKVKANVIGVTNSIKRFTGMVGVRFTESDEFGPTAEKFDGTNIVGEVVGSVEALMGMKGKQSVYLMEVS